MYQKFQKINGTHPWRNVSPDGYEDYPVRYRKGGRVIFFNYPLAREMGLIPQKHPTKMKAKLEEAILKDGLRNPSLVVAGWCRENKLANLPPEMQEDHKKISGSVISINKQH